jgi:hypothetical protein
MTTEEYPDVLCACGCGKVTARAKRNDSSSNRIKGRPNTFIIGHSGRLDRQRRVRPDFEVVDRGYITPCWKWLRSKSGGGYGSIRLTATGKKMQAHRHYYEQRNGPIPEGLQIDHLCRFHDCVNPDHLEAVTSVINTRRGNLTKLTEWQVKEIRQLWPIIPQSQIAQRFGICRGTVSDLIRRKSWKEVA